MDKSELKPCPFCGGDAAIENSDWGWFVTCSVDENCIAYCVSRYFCAPGEAIAAWNTRAQSARMAAAVEAERERGWNGALKMLDEWLVKALNETVFAKEVTIEHQEATFGAFRAARGTAASMLCRDETGFLVDAETPVRIQAAIRSQSNE